MAGWHWRFCRDLYGSYLPVSKRSDDYILKKPRHTKYTANHRRYAVDPKEQNANAFETVIRVAMHSDPKPTSFPQTDGLDFPMPVIAPTSGEWIFAADCPICSRPSPLFRDLSRGQFPRPFEGRSQVSFDCSRCDEPVNAPLENLYAAQWSVAH